MLHKIMQEDSDTWEALRIMNDLKALAPGFNICLQKDCNGKPIGVMYMTAQMRYNAHQYGSVLCLDAQNIQYNSSDWKYIIAPVVKDNEMKAAVVANSIVTEETHEFYIWILQQCMVAI